MALIVGTDTYDTLANVDAYWVARGNTAWDLLDDATAEINIRKATDWIDRTFSFVGSKLTSAQRLQWYREGACVDGFTVATTEYPNQLKEAVAIVADIFRAGSVDMEGIVTSDTAITKEKVDVIEVEYDAASRLRGPAIPSHVYQLLSPLTRQNSLVRA